VKVTPSPATNPPGGDILVYEDPGGRVRVDVRRDRETVWLTQQQMAELFGRDKPMISRHLRNVFQSGELERQGTVAKIATLQREGGRVVARESEYFNLDAILLVGYRVNFKRGTQFRVRATKTLRDALLPKLIRGELRVEDAEAFLKEESSE
jgi:hypothetical protein